MSINPSSTEPRDFSKARIRTKVEAKLLDLGARAEHKKYGDQKRATIGAMGDTIVEFGPGTGANMRYFPDGARVIGIEPNEGMHAGLRAAADEHGVNYEIRTLYGERVDVEDEVADGVVGTLLLCGVENPAAVVSEIQRVLKPGGTYFFSEHVVAPSGSRVRRVQDLMYRPHRWMFNGCETNRDTEALLRDAGFSDLELEQIDEGPAAVYLRYSIMGLATK